MTGITNANPAVVTSPIGVFDGQTVLLYATTGMSQIAGMSFTASLPTGTGFTLAGLDASGFANPATNVLITIPAPLATAPQFLYITGIQKNGFTSIVTVSTIHTLIPNQLVYLSIPVSFGMYEANAKTAMILSVTSYTLTIDLDTTNFNNFSFPSNTTNYIIPLFATLSPAGARNEYNITTIPFHQT